MAGSERPTPVPRAPRQGRLAPQHARVPAQRHSPTHVHVLAHVQQAIHELGREFSLSLSLLFALFLPPSVALPRSPFSDPRIRRSLVTSHICAPSILLRVFSHVYRTRYILLTLLDSIFLAPGNRNCSLLFTTSPVADGLNNTGE